MAIRVKSNKRSLSLFVPICYDLGRLTEVKENSVVVESYAYDADGNRTLETNTARGITAKVYDYSNEDHIITAGSDLYVLNVDGFLTDRTSTAGATSYDYSLRGELLSVDLADGRIVTYDHDPMGRRIAKKIDGTVVEKYLWQNSTTLLAVYDGSDNLIECYNYADGRLPISMLRGGSTYYMMYDQVGSLRLIVDTSGNITKRVDYDSFGNIISDSNPGFTISFGFAGGLHDIYTGLVRFGARDFDPTIGRWTAKDPIDFAGGDINLYGYVQHNPVNFIDPEGLLVLYYGGGGAAGAGYKVNPGDHDSINFFSGTITEFYGSNRSGGISNGNAFTGGAGRIVGAAAGGGALVGINFGDVEDLSGCGSSAGLLVGPFSFELTLDGDGQSITGFSFGFLNKGLGLGLFGQETRTGTISN